MRKLFKKSLACVLAVALCLTAMVGVLSVSADVTGTLEVQAVDSNVGENPYVIATFASADANELISEAFIKVEGASIATVAPVDGATGYAVELNDAKDIFNINSENGVASAAVKVVLDVTEAGEYTIKFIDVTSATDSQQLITFPTVEAAVKVASAHEHNYVGTETKAATCEEDGVKTFACECGVGTYTEAIPAIGHKWNDGVETTAPTCDNAGVITYTCLNDGAHTKTDAISPLGHDMKPVDEVPATCTTPGKEAGEKCSRCDATTGMTEIPALGHAWGEGVVTVEATKDAEGVRTFTCGTCGTTKTETIAKPTLYSATSIGGTLVVADKFAYRLGVYTTETKKFDSYKLVVTKNIYEGSNYAITEDVEIFTEDLKTADSTSTRDYFNVYAAAFAVDLDINAVLYFYDKDGNTVHYYEKVYNIADRAKRYVTENDPSTPAGLKQVKFFMDMLNYCAAAQTHFKTDTNGLKDAVLVNEGLDEYQKYATQEVPDFSGVANNNNIKTNSTVATIGKTIIIGDSNYIRYNITVPNGTEGLQLRVTYRSSYANVNASYQPVVKTYNLADLPVEGGRPYLLFTDVTLFDTHVSVKAEILQNGEPVVENDYNIAYFVNSRIGTNPQYADLQNILTAMAKFADSAKVYFGYEN